MGYATPDMVRSALRLADAAPPDTVRIPVDALNNDLTIAPHILKSDAIVGTYCSGKDVADGLLAALSTDIAAYFLVLAYHGSVDMLSGDPAVLLYQNAMSILEDIGSGKINPVSVDPDGPSDLGAGAVYNPPTPCLTTVDWFGRPQIVDQPWGYPGAW